MTTLAALIAERRARIEAFEKDTSSHAVHDISRPGCFGGTPLLRQGSQGLPVMRASFRAVASR